MGQPGGKSERSGLWVLAAGSAIYVGAVFVASLRPGPGAWGFHLSGFLPGPLGVLLEGLLVFGAAGVAVAALRPNRDSTSRRPRARTPRMRAGMRFAPLLLPLAGVLWLCRERTYFLGDQLVWLDNLPAGRDPVFSEPLAARIWGGFAALLRTLALPVDAPHLAILPVGCGVIAMALSWGIVRELTSRPGDRVFALALIATAGVSQLYFGHIESYAVIAVFLLAYILIGIRAAEGDGSWALLPAALIAAIASHLVLLFLYPSYILATLSRHRRSWERVALAFAPLVLAGVVITILGFGVQDILRPFRTLYAGIAGGGSSQEAHAGGLTQALVDFVNSIGLVMPVPALLLLARVASARPGSPSLGSPAQRFLALAAAGGLLAGIALVLGGTSAQDWDLLAVTLIPVALFGISFVGTTQGGAVPTRARFGLVSIALGSLLAFALVNAGERPGVRRFECLMAPPAHLRHHERAFGSEKLVKYYSAHRDYTRMLVYARQAAEAEPTIPRYWSNVGTALYGLGRFDEAARFFEEAARKGMRQPQLFYTLGLCYMNLKEPALAAARFRTANDISGGTPEYLTSLGFALLASGDTAGARATWRQVLARWPEQEDAREAYERFFGPDSATSHGDLK